MIKAGDTPHLAASPLTGPWCEVIYILAREGPRGGAYWFLVLECGHGVTRDRHSVRGLVAIAQAMFIPLDEKLAPKRVQCHHCEMGSAKRDPWVLIKALEGASDEELAGIQ